MKIYEAQPGIMADYKYGCSWFGKYFVSNIKVLDMRYILKILTKYYVKICFLADYEPIKLNFRY